jgi:hypothetical protein
MLPHDLAGCGIVLEQLPAAEGDETKIEREVRASVMLQYT